MFPDPPAEVALAESSAAPDTEYVSAANVIGHDEFYISSSGESDDPITVTTKRVSYDETSDQTLTQSKSSGSNRIPRLSDDLLRTIKDDVIGVHSTESEAYFAALKMALRAEGKSFDKPTDGAYALFMDSPNGSRGNAYKVEGKLRRLSIVRGRANSLGVGAVYDAWVSTEDSGDQLVHVVALKAEGALAGLIKDNDPDRSVDFDKTNSPEIQFVGYFFKIEGYASYKESGISRAPLLLAGTLKTIPPPALSSNRADQLTPYLGYLAIIICASVMFMVWSFAMSDVAHTQTRAHQLTKLPAVASFDDVTSMSVVESLNELEFANSNSDANSNRLN